MPLSAAFLKEIDGEIAALRDYREGMIRRVDQRIAALEAVRQPWDFAQVALPFSHAHPDLAIQLGESMMLVETKTSANTGLRAAIIEAVKANGPSRAPDVAKVLKAKGFLNDSKTSLPVRVYNDMWRMTKSGFMVSDRGKFSLVRRSPHEKDSQS